MVRPRIEENKGFETPNFKVERMNGWTCPRDVITVVGNEIIEAPTPWRTRNFEVCCIFYCATVTLGHENIFNFAIHKSFFIRRNGGICI